MNRVGRWLATLMSAAAGGTAFFILLVSVNPRSPGESLASGYGVTMAVLATPWALTVGILWHAWWLRVGARLSATDVPGALLATAVATLPAERRDWGAAMSAELAQVPDRLARWRFAAGCARTAVFPPRHHRLPVLAVAALAAAAVAGTGFAVGRTLPAMRVFAVTFVVLVGVLAVVAAARSRRLYRPPNGPLVAIAGLAGVAAVIAAIGYNLGTHAAGSLDRSVAITLAVVLATCLWLTLAPPRALTTSRPARWTGVGAGLLLAAVMFLAARVNETGGEGILAYLPGVPAVFFIASALVAVSDRSFLAGLQTTVWGLIVACLSSFAIFVVEAMRWSAAHQTSLLDGDAGTGGQLDAAFVWVLLAVPVLAIPAGVIGAALGGIGTMRPNQPEGLSTTRGTG